MNRRNLRRVVEYKYQEHPDGDYHSGSFIRPANWSDSDLLDTLFEKLANDSTENEYHTACETVFAVTYREGFRTTARSLL